MTKPSQAMPWMKFFPTDWRADPALRSCSLAARGLWIELLGVMHEAEPYGYLLLAGRPPTTAQIASVVGATEPEVEALLAELERAHVFSRRRRDAAIYSRRMISDERKRRISRKNGRRGGNPTLSRQRENQSRDNPQDKPGVPPRGQRPEARGQRPEERASDEALSGNHTTPAPGRDPDLMDRLRSAALRDPAKAMPAKWTDPWLAPAADRWGRLGLTTDQILDVLHHRRPHDGDALTPTYYDGAMSDLATHLSRPEPTSPGAANDRPNPRRETAADRRGAATRREADRLARIADALERGDGSGA